MEIDVKKIQQPFNKRYVDVLATGEVKIFQESGVEVRVKNNNSEIEIKDNHFCLNLPTGENKITKITRNPLYPGKIIFRGYNVVNGKLVAERTYKIIDVNEEMEVEELRSHPELDENFTEYEKTVT